MSKPRIIFAGTPDFAAICLQSLIEHQYHLVAVYTQPDRPAGRGKKLQPSPVKRLAEQHQIPVEQPLNFKLTEDCARLADYNADLMIVVAYGLLLPQSVLDTPRLGCVNVHASLLPRWRGAAPIQRAIEAGDQETGVGIMQMDRGLDTGAVWKQASCPIEIDETGDSLHDKLAALGAETLIKTLDDILTSTHPHVPVAQSTEGITYAHKLTKQQARIDWTQSAATIERKIRALNSWPVAYFDIAGEPIRIWSAKALSHPHTEQPGTVVQSNKQLVTIACGEGCLQLLELQPAGSRRMTVKELLNSKAHWFQAGHRIGH